MKTTHIHTTKKLEKLVKKLMSTDQESNPGILGKWKANIFYVNRKKCWLITNGLTKYNVILTDIKASDYKKMDQIFKDALCAQFIYDGIPMNFETLDTMVGKLNFLPTDNDRSTAGFQNQSIELLDWWKDEFGTIENMPINDLTNRMNTVPIHLGKGRKMSDFTDSVEEMKNLLKA